jgi:hypothetical protein
MTKTFNAWDYWPKVPDGKIYSFTYIALDGSMKNITSMFVNDPTTNSLLYVDYDSAMNWQDTWYLQYRKGFGIAEWRDDYPTGGLLDGHKKVVMDGMFGTPIGWGDVGTIGGSYQNKPKMNPVLSNPPQFSTGTQTVIWESALNSFALSSGVVYNDVITVVYQQSWGSKTAGARYWFAKGIGPIALQWIAPDPNNKGQFITTSRMDSRLTIINGTVESIKH